VPDVGFGEIIMIVVVALLVFGPDRLPKVAADAARTLRQVRQMAASARKDLVDAAGIEQDEELSQAVRDLRDLDPRRAMDAALSDGSTPTSTSRAAQSAGASTSAPRPGSAPAAGSGPSAAAGSGPGTGSLPGTVPGAGAQPVAPPVVAPAAADPDWT
jgi:sec-independent protein translocase protein TatB